MPRLSLYRPEKGNDYKFFDRRISEMFTVGGVDVNIHKYLGTVDVAGTSATEPGNTSPLSTGITGIQDLLFLENRDRKYDTSVYTMRSQFRINDNDFDLTQFGLFLTGDTMFATFHLNDMIDNLGRKLMVGDVIEIPVFKEFYPLDDSIPVALKRFFVVQDASRAAEGFAPTWYPHLWRVKLQPLVDSQEYKDIINQIAGDNTTNTLGDVLSTYNKYIGINDAIVARAEQDVPASGYDTSSFYTEPVNPDGTPGPIDSNGTVTTPTAKITGYLTQDALPPNGETVAAGITFPAGAVNGDFFLRLDYVPNRLFRFDGRRWVKIEDNLRTNLTPGATNTTQRSGFVNDTNQTMSNAVVWDAVRISSNYTPDANAATLSFTLSTKTVVTKVPYVRSYGVRSHINGTSVTNTIANASGNLSFTVSSTLSINDLLEYTVYKHVINERQSLSQALRPTADNI